MSGERKRSLEPTHAFAVYTAGACVFGSRFFPQEKIFAAVAEGGERLTILPHGRVLRLSFTLASRPHVLLVLLQPNAAREELAAVESDAASLTDNFTRMLILTRPEQRRCAPVSERTLLIALQAHYATEISDRIRIRPSSDALPYTTIDEAALLGAVAILLFHTATAYPERFLHLSLRPDGVGRHAICFDALEEEREPFLETLVGEIAKARGFSFSYRESAYYFGFEDGFAGELFPLRATGEADPRMLIQALYELFSL